MKTMNNVTKVAKSIGKVALSTKTIKTMNFISAAVTLTSAALTMAHTMKAMQAMTPQPLSDPLPKNETVDVETVEVTETNVEPVEVDAQ